MDEKGGHPAALRLGETYVHSYERHACLRHSDFEEDHGLASPSYPLFRPMLRFATHCGCGVASRASSVSAVQEVDMPGEQLHLTD